MKTAALILSSFVGSAIAAPAIVWKSERGASSAVVHSSELVTASELLSAAVGVPSDDASLAAVIFLVDRDEDGAESLTRLASSGSLPGVASKYDAAGSVHHHVSGIESAHTIARDANTGSSVNRVLQVSVSELNSKLTSFTENENSATSVDRTDTQAADLEADVLVVAVSSAETNALDDAVVSAIDHSAVKNVILAGIRSSDEVKYERKKLAHMKLMQQAAPVSRSLSARASGRRRLDDNNNNAQNQNANAEDEDVYYVYMTPNILAGILFTLFFIFIVNTGIGCMGLIEGQDTYVSKMPSVGREA